MGVVKTASESILEETVVPSEEANYSLQSHTGEREFFKYKLNNKHLIFHVYNKCFFISVLFFFFIFVTVSQTKRTRETEDQ